jgi:capsular polysaccharide biosynthesis protein
MSEQSFNSIHDGELSLKDTIDLFIESWKLIVVTGLLGVLAAIGYLMATPNQYQATAQIQMAQLITGSSYTNISRVNVEDPNLLMTRLKLPTSYSPEVIKLCGFENESFPAESLASSIKFSSVKGTASMVELKINRDSKEVALDCTQALFESIKTFQYQIIKAHVERLKALLINSETKLANVQSFFYRMEKLDAAPISASYLFQLDEIRFLKEEIFRLNTNILYSDGGGAKLIAPIYVFDAPIFPKKKISLIIGLMAGIFLGLLFVILKGLLKTYRAS